MSEAKTTTDHEQIKRWVEECGGHPARVAGTAVEGSSGVLLIDYPGYSGTQTLEQSAGMNSSRALKKTN